MTDLLIQVLFVLSCSDLLMLSFVLIVKDNSLFMVNRIHPIFDVAGVIYLVWYFTRSLF